MRLTAATLDAPNARELAAFYLRLLPGWRVWRGEDGQDWVHIRPPDGGTGLSFQTEPAYRPPVWPSTPDGQQMMIHLDIEVDDLESETARALAEGARLAAYQPQDGVRVLLDPVGHPFCLFTEAAEASQ
ncbi:VOC family protein [Streptomyces coeruleorubidus]|uniref:VOC family protein n=1 Tax=Streptomyces coeruleorubidus TaxID=116188 RepID=A0A5J6I1I7_STRC4|nr:VOC family protein [Streptomyces coeruleorubidus]QEV26286.1 VOC family protein [Streptomyces coeruleorubidus]GGT75679.1 glyoxalase [Streptomyces coeruleorubidus]